MKTSAKDFFNRESSRYREFVRGRDFVPFLIEKLTPFLKGKILDVGSGCIREFNRGDSNLYVALDLSVDMLSALDRGESTPAVCGDAARLPFQDRSFDVIIYRSVLHHLNPEGRLLREMGETVVGALQEAKRVSGPDGRIFVVEPCLSPVVESLERWFSFVIRTVMNLAGLPCVFLFSVRRLSCFLEKGGWSDLKLTRIARTGKRWDWITPILGLPFLKIPRWLSPSHVCFLEGGRRDGV